MRISSLSLVLLALTLGGCVTAPPEKDYGPFSRANVRSILVVPVINHSAETQAADYFLTTMAVPLAERGYYVFPTSASKRLIESDGLADPQLIHGAPAPRIASLFGADAVMYVEVVDWKAQYAVLSSSVFVHFLYTLKDGKTDQLLWQDEQALAIQTSGGSGNLLADAVAAAVTSAVDKLRGDFTRVAVAANAAALLVDKQGIPYGPYSPLLGSNAAKFPATGTGHVSNAKLSAVSYVIEGAETTSAAAEAAKAASSAPAASSGAKADPKP